MVKKINLAEYVERRKGTGSVVVDLGDGKTVTIPPLELWADEVFDTASAGDTKAAMAMLLGDEGAQAFIDAGGNYRMLSGIVRDQLGLSVGESEASSPS